jgi:hypothetical protein
MQFPKESHFLQLLLQSINPLKNLKELFFFIIRIIIILILNFYSINFSNSIFILFFSYLISKLSVF